MTQASNATDDRGTAILVLGMHRSGTSAVAGALRLRGFALGDDLMPAGPDNPSGFWEHTGVVAIHERLLHALDRDWRDPRPLPPGWLESQPAAEAEAALVELLAREFGGMRWWAVKDPRLCLVLPLWRRVLARLHVAAHAVLVVRDPREVAASLQSRNDWPAGLSDLLWMRYLLEAEAGSRGMPRALLPYAALLRDPRAALDTALRTLDIGAGPDACAESARALADFVRPSGQHHAFAEAAPGDGGLASRMFQAATSNDAPWRSLASVRGEYEAAMAVSGAAVADAFALAAKEYREREALAVRIEDSNALARMLERRAGDAEALLEERTRWARSLEDEVSAARTHARSLDERIEERTRWALRLEEERSGLRDEVDRWMEAMGAGLRRYGIAGDTSSPAAAASALSRLGEERDALSGRVNRIETSWSWRITLPLRVAMLLLRGDVRGLLDGLRASGIGRSGMLAPLRRCVARRAGYLAASAAPAAVVEPPPAPSVDGLALPASTAPRVSVLIPAYGKTAYTLACLRSIARHPPGVPFEVIVIEDASGEPDAMLLREVPGLRYHENAENLGFLRSCNAGAGLARGEFLCLLNNDTEVTAGWLDALLAVFGARPDAGLAGARLVYPDGRQQEAGGIVWDDASAWNYGRLQDPAAGEFGYLKPVDYVSAAAVLLRTALFRELGGFDERYAPAYCEDTDLAFRIREAGLQVYYQPRAVVVHHEGVSHGTDTGQGLKAYQVANQAKFLERWRDELARTQFGNAEWPFLARDRSQLRKGVLVVDHYVPQPDRDAGSRTMWQFMRLFLAHGMAVKFLPANFWYDETYAPRLEAEGIEVLHGNAFAGGGFRRWLRENGPAIDYVLVSRPHVADMFLDDIRAHTDATVLFYGHDIHHLRMAAQAEADPGSVTVADIQRQRATEERAWRSADRIYYPAEGETALVNAWCVRAGLEPNGLTIPVYAFDAFPAQPWASLGQRSDLLFVAGFAHPPNADAAAWFVAEVMPKLRARHPGVRLLLVGSNPTAQVRRLAGDDIVVTGFVSDEALAAYYASARVAVAPLRYGGGMKGKVVEAMRFGLPCVTSAAGAQGLEAARGFLFEAGSADAFAEKVSRLLDDDAAWTAASQASQAFAQERFSEDALWRVVARDVDPAPYPDIAARRRRLDAARRNMERK